MIGRDYGVGKLSMSASGDRRELDVMLDWEGLLGGLLFLAITLER
jgi:hypothetical protein